MSDGRKKYLLRIPHELYAIYERWAADEFRSVNAQIEATLVDAARRSGRLKPASGADPPTSDDTAPDRPGEDDEATNHRADGQGPDRSDR